MSEFWEGLAVGFISLVLAAGVGMGWFSVRCLMIDQCAKDLTTYGISIMWQTP